MNMIKRLLIFSFVLLFSSSAFAQYTFTSGTVIDKAGTTWFNAKVQVTFVPNPAYPNMNQYNFAGVNLTTDPVYKTLLNQNVTTNGSGAFIVQLMDNSTIAPGGSSWKFTIQSYTSAPSATFPNLAVQGSSTDVSAFLLANITNPSFSAVAGQYGGAFGYNTAEVTTIPVPGGSFFNVTTGVINVWACSGVGACSWQTQAVGSFCSSISCSFTTSIFSPNINNVCEASLQAGAVDFVDGINKCANQSYMSTGGIITMYGYPQTDQYSTTIMTALGTASRPIILMVGSNTRFFFNQVFSTATVNNNIVSNTSGQGQACIVPIAQGSGIKVFGGLNSRELFNLGPSAYTYDFICNANQDGTQESLTIDGLSVVGNYQATMKGSLFHLVQVYGGTHIDNFTTYYPFGNSVTLSGTNDITFNNPFIADEYPRAGGPGGLSYPGAVLTLNCNSELTFNGGLVQGNGPYNPMILGQNCSVADSRTPTTGPGYSNQHIVFRNTYIETNPATVGSFSGHATNVDPIQIIDPSNWVFDQQYVGGTVGAGQLNFIDLTASGSSTGAYAGPFTANNLAIAYAGWSGKCLVNNTLYTNASNKVSSTLRCWKGSQNGALIGGIYNWAGSNANQQSYNEYRDYVNYSSVTAEELIVPPVVFSTLATCSSTLEGKLAPVSDSTTNIPGRLVTGGGTYHVAAYCNGTSWSVAGGNSTALSQAFTICSSGCTYNTTICTTTGVAWGGGGCGIGVFAWPVPFADLNYSSHCDVVTPLAGGVPQPFAAFVYLYPSSASGKTTGGISVSLMSATANAITAQEIECMGIHN